jgi:hypothetical protein
MSSHLTYFQLCHTDRSILWGSPFALEQARCTSQALSSKLNLPGQPGKVLVGLCNRRLLYLPFCILHLGLKAMAVELTAQNLGVFLSLQAENRAITICKRNKYKVSAPAFPYHSISLKTLHWYVIELFLSKKPRCLIAELLYNLGPKAHKIFLQICLVLHTHTHTCTHTHAQARMLSHHNSTTPTLLPRHGALA